MHELFSPRLFLHLAVRPFECLQTQLHLFVLAEQHFHRLTLFFVSLHVRIPALIRQ